MLNYRLMTERQPAVKLVCVTSSHVNPPSTTVCEVGMMPNERFFYVLRGKIVFDTPHGHIEAPADSIVYLPTDCIYRSHWESEDYGEYISVIFELGEGERFSLSDRIEVAAADEGKKYIAFFKRFRNNWFGNEPGKLLGCMALFWELLHNLYADSVSSTLRSKYDSISGAVEYIGCNYRTAVDTDRLARLCGMSVSSFRREFKARFGVSPVKYRNSLRLQRARELLESGSCNVTEASSMVGITDIFYFSKLYKREFGVSPSEEIPHNAGRLI